MTEIKALADRVLSLEKRIAELEARQRPKSEELSSKNSKELTVREFMLAKRPSNDVEKTLTIGFFLEKFSGTRSFNVEDLAQNFALAKEACPPNINDKVNMNIKKGHMAEVREKKDKKKAWMLTNSGERFVESGFKETKK